MRQPLRMLFVSTGAIAVLAALGACSGVRDNLGLVRRPPDEFTVVRKPPLAIPPNFSLRPPRTGSDIAEETDSAKKARSALLGGGAAQPTGTQAQPASAGGSSGERAFLAKAGAANADIRDVLNRETTILEEKDRSFVDRLVFWRREGSETVGGVVDARKESERLKQVSAAGESPTSGETPVIKRHKRALLEGIF